MKLKVFFNCYTFIFPNVKKQSINKKNIMNKIIILAGLGLFTQYRSQELQKTMIPKISHEFEKITIQNSKKKMMTDVLKLWKEEKKYFLLLKLDTKQVFSWKFFL